MAPSPLRGAVRATAFGGAIGALMFPATARADPPIDVSALPATEQVRVVPVDWRALDVASDVRPGEAAVHSDVVSSADFGSWVTPLPGGFDAVRVAGGDVGLSPRLSLRLLGAEQLGSSASAMTMGLEVRLLEPGPWRISVIGGYQEDLTRVRSFWTEALVSYRRGHWEYGVSMRQQAAPGSGTRHLTAVTGAAYGAEAFRVGLEYVSGVTSSVARHALIPSVSTVVDHKVTIKAASTIGLHGVGTAPARVSVSSAF